MPANLENSAVAIGLEKVRFHSNPKERQCQRTRNSQALNSNFIGDVFGLLMMLGARSWGGPDK